MSPFVFTNIITKLQSVLNFPLFTALCILVIPKFWESSLQSLVMVVLKLELFNRFQASSIKLRKKKTNKQIKNKLCVSVCTSVWVSPHMYFKLDNNPMRNTLSLFYKNLSPDKINCPWWQGICYKHSVIVKSKHFPLWHNGLLIPVLSLPAFSPGLLSTHPWGHTILAYSF